MMPDAASGRWSGGTDSSGLNDSVHAGSGAFRFPIPRAGPKPAVGAQENDLISN